MTNKKFKLAAMSLATAVAVSAHRGCSERGWPQRFCGDVLSGRWQCNC